MPSSEVIEDGQDNSIIAEFWPTFNIDLSIPTVECSRGGSLAVDVLDTFGIPKAGSAGGPLLNVDIKRADALTVLKQSLMEESVNGALIEPMVNEYGEVEFVTIGGTAGISDIYYTVQTANYKEEAKGVMVTGGRPLPTRKAIEWKPIWGLGDVNIYSFQDMITNCHWEGFNRYATIVFDDPNLDSKYEDGIDNLFEIVEPFERIIGYVTYVKPPKDYMHNDVSVNYVNRVEIPVLIGYEGGVGNFTTNNANLGILQRLARMPAIGNAECWSGEGQGTVADYNNGVKIEIRNRLRFETVRETTVDKFVRVSGIYVVGKEIIMLHAAPFSEVDVDIESPNTSQVKIFASIEDTSSKTFRLQEGYQYAIAYSGDPGEFPDPYVVFSEDVLQKDAGVYGTGTWFYLYPTCAAAQSIDYDSVSLYQGSILPVNKNKGILVEQIWATVEIESPCIQIHDPKGKAVEIAEHLIYQLGAMKVIENPAPTAFAGVGYTGGTLIDQESAVVDNDPTTSQPLEETEMDGFLDIMQGGGMAITLSFLDETNVRDVAASIYQYMQTGEGTTTVTTCGPAAKPQLGGQGLNGIINSIQYSYSDKGSYTISVQEGPWLVGGLTSVDGGPSQKAVEDQGFSGTVIQDPGNGVVFKVRIDGYGERWAVNTSFQILRVGDRVSGSIHNNPVEA